MTHPIPTQTSQKPPMPWAKVWMEIAGLVPVEIFFIVLGAVAALVPTLIVWTNNGSIEAGTLVFWCKWGMGLGAAICGWFFWCSGLDVWREARGRHIAVDPTPFEEAAWAAFREWLAEGGHRKAHADGHTTLTFVAPWQVADGNAVARYGPLFETEYVNPKGFDTPSRLGARLAWIPNDVAVPEERARRAYSQQKSGHVAVRIGPFSVGTAHGLLALERMTTPTPTTAPSDPAANGPSI